MNIEIFKKYKFLTALLVFVGLLVFLSNSAGPKAKEIKYGVTFSPYQAQSLGLDWKETYLAMVGDLGVKHLRLSAYWNKIESKKGEYNFSDLDFQMREAEKANAKVVLALGRRLPRWPECHDPEWLKNGEAGEWQNSLLAYMEAVVLRYQNSSALEIWQVENEPFLSSFGECPPLDQNFFDKEIALVKRLDPGRRVMVTDTGELSPWLSSGKRGDMFGSTLYRYVFSDVFNRYWMNYNPYWLYRVKGGLMKLLNGPKELTIIELQAEPWTTKGILNTPINEQFRTMSLDKFNKMVNVGKAIGFERQYLWGVEWWFWMKQNNHPEFWNEAKKLMQ